MDITLPLNITGFMNNKTKDSQPDFTGLSKDKQLRVAVWKAEDKFGKMKLSIKISENNFKKE